MTVKKKPKQKKKNLKFPKRKPTNVKPYDLSQGVTQSILTTWLMCRQLARHTLECWESPRPRDALVFGSFWHWLLEMNYELLRKEGSLWEFEHLAQQWMEKIGRKLADPTKAQQHLAMAEALYDEYWDYWGNHKDSDYERNWIGIESVFDLSFHGYRLRGMRDGLYRNDRGKLWLLETKTAAGIDEGTLTDELVFNFQNLFYITAAEIEYDETVEGVLYNMIKKPGQRFTGTFNRKSENIMQYKNRIHEHVLEHPDEYFHRFEIKYSKKHKDNFKRDLLAQLEEFTAWWKGDMATYKGKFCVTRWTCEFLKACAQDNMAGYTQSRILFGELAEA